MTVTPLQHNSCHWQYVRMQVLHRLFKVTFTRCASPASDVKRHILYLSAADSKASTFQSEPAALGWRAAAAGSWTSGGGKTKSKPSCCFGERRDVTKVEVTQCVERTSLAGLSVSGSCGNHACTSVLLCAAAKQQVSSEHWGGNQRREGQQTLGLQDQVDRVSVSTHTSPSTNSLHCQKNNCLHSKLGKSNLYWVLVFLLLEATGGVASKIQNCILSKRRHRW